MAPLEPAPATLNTCRVPRDPRYSSGSSSQNPTCSGQPSESSRLSSSSPHLRLRSAVRPDGLMGAELFDAGCAGCHGPEGSGAPDSAIGFEKPSTYPDFSACDQTSPEVQQDWWAVIHDGGKARGFSRIMPAFGELLTTEQITSLVEYIRGLCHDKAWAPGEMNLPRPLVTEKAFPESETVFASTIAPAAEGSRGHDATYALQYERRFSARDQLELSVPSRQPRPDRRLAHRHRRRRIGWKHVLYSSHAHRIDLQRAGCRHAAAGNADNGLGSGHDRLRSIRCGRPAARTQRRFVQGQPGSSSRPTPSIAPRAVLRALRRRQVVSRGSRPRPHVVADGRAHRRS